MNKNLTSNSISLAGTYHLFIASIDNMNQENSEREIQQVFKTLPVNLKNDSGMLINAQQISAPLVARMFDQARLGSKTSTPIILLDNGCGPGFVTEQLQSSIPADVLKQSKIICGDFSQQMVDLTSKRIKEEGWVNTEARVIDAQVRPHSAQGRDSC